MSGFYASNMSLDKNILQEKYKKLSFRGDKSSNKILGNVILHENSFNAASIEESGEFALVGDVHVYGNYTKKDIIRLYKEHGPECLKRLNGGFAFVIYDATKNIIFGARDRLGEKPFFYYCDQNGLECSSSLKAVAYNKKLSINENARNMYAKFGFIYDSECIFNETKKLQSGHYFVYDLKSGKLNVEKYWDCSEEYFDVKTFPRSVKANIDHIGDLIEDSVNIRIPDDPCAMGISFGTDAFAIFCHLHNLKKDAELFCVINNSKKEYNEFPLATKHVKFIDPEKNINPIYFNKDLFKEGVESYLAFYEEPNSDFSCVNTTVMFHEMQKHGFAKAFSGLGSDDIFFAKPNYKNAFNDVSKYYLSYSRGIDDLFLKPIEVDDSYAKILKQDDLRTLQRYDIKSYLPNLLVKEDIASQHHKIDTLNPFCDYRLVEYLNILDLNIIFYDNKFKYLLKKLIKNKFNVDFFKEKRKKGMAPLPNFIATVPEVRKEVEETLTEDNLLKYFPDISVMKVKEAVRDYDVRRQRHLLNLFFYIKLLESYQI